LPPPVVMVLPNKLPASSPQSMALGAEEASDLESPLPEEPLCGAWHAAQPRPELRCAPSTSFEGDAICAAAKLSPATIAKTTIHCHFKGRGAPWALFLCIGGIFQNLSDRNGLYDT